MFKFALCAVVAGTVLAGNWLTSAPAAPKATRFDVLHAREIVLTSPNGRHTITLLASDEGASVFVKGKTGTAVVRSGSDGCYAGVIPAKVPDDYLGNPLALGVDADGEGFVQLVSGRRVLHVTVGELMSMADRKRRP